MATAWTGRRRRSGRLHRVMMLYMVYPAGMQLQVRGGGLGKRWRRATVHWPGHRSLSSRTLRRWQWAAFWPLFTATQCRCRLDCDDRGVDRGADRRDLAVAKMNNRMATACGSWRVPTWRSPAGPPTCAWIAGDLLDRVGIFPVDRLPWSGYPVHSTKTASSG